MIDNVYPESVEESGSYLRITLKNISENQLPYNPIAYSLWYDYATGRNPKLIEDIRLVLEANKKIEYETITDLFRKHIADNQLLLAEKKAREFQKILAEVIKQMTSSDGEIQSKGDTLNELTEKLEKASSETDISEIAGCIVDQTRSIVGSSMLLSKQINDKLNEIRTLRKELEGIKKTAKTDILTGLLNRRGFEEAMEFVLEKMSKKESPMSIIMMDIDHFKTVNDQHGHLIGDNVIKVVSKVIQANIKGKDVACRYGGDEFILALPDTPAKGAYVVAEKLRENLRNTNWKVKGTGQSLGQISLSLGIAVYKAGQNLEAVIQQADGALYRSKHSGRNRTTIMDDT